MSQPEPKKRKEDLDNREEAQAQSAGAGTAVEAAFRQHDLDREQFIDKLRDVAIEGDEGEAIKEELDAEMAGIYAMANEGDDDYRRHKWLTRNKRERYIASRNPGRLCQGPFLQLARGTNNREETGTEHPYSHREKKKLREAMDGKIALHSLAKGGEGLAAVSEITAVTEHRRETDPGQEDTSSGIIGRIFK